MTKSFTNTKPKKTVVDILMSKEAGIAFVLFILVATAAMIEPRFLSPANIRSILLYVPLILVVAMGQMMVIISRNIDLSVGSILGFTGISIGLLFIKFPGFPIWLAAIVCILIGATLGLVNGVLITWFKVPAIITTLGTMSVYRGLLFIISGGRQIDPQYIPVDLIRLSQKSLFGVPWLVLFAAFIALLTYLFLNYSFVGREVFAVGSNPTAAKLRGISVHRIVLLVFTISGAFAGLAGIMYASRFGYINPNMTGLGFEFVVITATIIGGTSVFGGIGSVLGVVLGCLLIGVLNVALAIIGVSAFWQQATYGIGILVALLIDRAVQMKFTTNTKEGV
jgi:rhamnose transport system permease protein